jgi:putative hydrolase of the HAD superfamily
MPLKPNITTLFLDIGGVLLTNGWDRRARQAAVEKFELDFEEIDERHHMTFDTYEEGKLSLDEYLSRVIFFRDRKFTREDFKAYVYSQSRPLEDMLDLIRKIIIKHNLRAIAVSNEGRELTEYRIKKYDLTSIISAFVASCFVHYRKPDIDIYKIALDISQAEPNDVVYIDDRPMFVEIASTLGIHGICHENFKKTRDKLAEYGLSIGTDTAYKIKPGV